MLPTSQTRPAVERSSQLTDAQQRALVILGVLVMLLPACGGGDRATPTPTVFSQPTANQTMDAVVRGLVTVGLPQVTRTATAIAQRAPLPPSMAPLPTPLPVSTLPLAPTLPPPATRVPLTPRPTQTPAG